MSVDHVWALERPELFEPVERVEGQSRKHYDQAVSRTRSELAAICGRAADQLERTGTTATRVVDPDEEDRQLGWGGRRRLRLPPHSLRLP